jgi:hypothetical protein
MAINKDQIAAVGFAGIGGAMAGLAAALAAKKCYSQHAAGRRVIAGAAIGAAVGIVAAVLPAILLYGKQGAAPVAAEPGA